MITMKLNSIYRQSGIALVIVLWMLSLLIILAMGYSRMVRIETSLTANLIHTSQARSLAEAGIWQSVSELLKPKIEQQWKTDGTTYSFEFEQGVVTINIVNETGKIDLNTAHSELLHGLINSIELPEENDLTLLQSILDWRDKDNLVRNYGAEDEDYRQRDYHYGAKDGPFNSLSELQLVMGMTTAIYNQLKPALTIYSHQSGINPDSAPKEALLAIPGISEAQVDDFLQSRSNRVDTITPASLLGINAKYLSNSNGQVFTIISEGVIGNTHAKLDAVILMKRHINKPFTVLSWQASLGRSKTANELEAENNPS
jgi:general secretion pathway protein K